MGLSIAFQDVRVIFGQNHDTTFGAHCTESGYKLKYFRRQSEKHITYVHLYSNAVHHVNEGEHSE